MIAEKCIKSVVDKDYILKTGTSSADYPELALVIAGLHGPEFQSSSSYSCDVLFDVMVSTGEISQTDVAKLTWWLYSRCVYLSAYAGLFKYNNLNLLKSVIFDSADVGLKPQLAQRNAYGWCNLTRLRAALSVPNSLFLES